MNIESFNPFTEEIEKTFTEESPETVTERIKQAYNFFGEFREFPIAARCEILTKTSAILSSRKDELARLITLEMGKPISVDSQGITQIIYHIVGSVDLIYETLNLL